MKHGHGERAFVVVALVAFSACADPANRIAGPVTQSADIQTGSAAPETEERAALTKVARLVAVALDNEPARQQLKRDMRASLFREHKLELGTYLRSKDGGALLSRMVEASGGSETEFFNTLNAVRRLEFYMPVASQRENWTGRDEVLVLSQLEESSPIVSFDSRGKTVALDRAAPPDQPTLSILPVETRFDQPMNPSTSRNARDENGTAIGTLEPIKNKPSMLIACGTECGGSDGYGGSSIPHGLYIQFSRIVDAKEPWFRGDPEIEVHIHGPTDVGNTRYGADLSCAGEHAGYPRNFDQNSSFWNGDVLLFDDDQINNFNNKFHEGLNILFWEDDDTSCSIKTDSNLLIEAIQQSAKAAGAAAAVKIIIESAARVLRVGTFVAAFFTSASWLLTNDDYLGVAVDAQAAGMYYPDATHVLMLGNTINGRTKLISH